MLIVFWRSITRSLFWFIALTGILTLYDAFNLFFRFNKLQNLMLFLCKKYLSSWILYLILKSNFWFCISFIFHNWWTKFCGLYNVFFVGKPTLRCSVLLSYWINFAWTIMNCKDLFLVIWANLILIQVSVNFHKPFFFVTCC